MATDIEDSQQVTELVLEAYRIISLEKYNFRNRKEKIYFLQNNNLKQKMLKHRKGY